MDTCKIVAYNMPYILLSNWYHMSTSHWVACTHIIFRYVIVFLQKLCAFINFQHILLYISFHYMQIFKCFCKSPKMFITNLHAYLTPSICHLRSLSRLTALFTLTPVSGLSRFWGNPLPTCTECNSFYFYRGYL